MEKLIDWTRAIDLKKVLRYFGLSDDENTENAQVTLNRSELYYPSIADELSYKYYDEKSQIFINEDSAGLLYRISPLTGANEAVAEQLDTILRNKVSHELTLQLIKITHNQLGPQIDRFAAQFKRKEFKDLSKLGQSLEDYYKRAAREGFATRNGVKARLTHSEVYLVVDFATRGKTEKDIRLFFDRFKVSFQAALTASSIGFENCNAVDLLHVLYLYLRHTPKAVYPATVNYQEDQLLKYQVVDNAFSLEVDSQTKDHLILRGDHQIIDPEDPTKFEVEPFETEVSVLSLDKVPSSFQLWNNINNSNNIFNNEYNLNCNHIVSVTYVIEEHTKALSKANRKTKEFAKKSNSEYSLFVAGVPERYKQWHGLREDLTKGATSSCHMLYNVVLFSEKGQRHQNVEEAINSFGFNGLKLSPIKYMQPTYFLASMPFLFTGNLQKDFALPQMMHHISSWNAVQYLPMLSDWQGQSSGVLLPSMRGQAALVDPFSGYFGTNFNASVTGTSGAGKSFLMQMMALSTLFDGGNVYIIDVGGSYKKLCKAVGGVELEYKNLAMNPFTFVEDIHAQIDDLILFFELLACPKQQASDDDSSALRRGILDAFEDCGRKSKVDDVQKALRALPEDEYPQARKLAQNIDCYCTHAEHGRAFNDESKLDPKARFIVVDLQEIEDKKKVIAPVLLAVFTQFHKFIFSSSRSVKKLCMLDEAWKFFEGDPRALDFLITGFRTGRRHQASFVTITQGVNDYFNFPEAEQLWDNSALKIILRQDPTTLLSFNEKRKLFSEYEMEILKKFPLAKKAGYSQVEIIGGEFHSFNRLFVDPFTLVMLSSAGEDYETVEALRKEGMDFLEAVECVARKHYGDMYAQDQ